MTPTGEDQEELLDDDVAEVDTLLVEHGLDPSLRDAVLSVLRRARSRVRTVLGGPTTRIFPFDPPALDTLVLNDASMSLTPTPPPPRSPVPAAALGPVPTSLVGRGGMGEVYRAIDPSLNRALAMKVLRGSFADDPVMRSRFLAEAQVTAQLAHPGVPPVHAVGELSDARPYISMKLVHGRTLSAVIALVRAGTSTADGWGESRRLDVFRKVCEAVAYAHAHGVVHCDLKPANIMVGEFGEVLVMDWGVARLVAPARGGAEPRVTLQGGAVATPETTIAGTPAYMPPEQATGDVARLGPTADVYALGVILYEILTGRPPYQGDPMQLLYQSGKGQVPPMVLPAGTTVDDALEGIVRKAMSPDPDDRYADAGALGADVARWREGALRRERALAVVAEARARLPEAARLRERARQLREDAARRLAALPAHAGAESKRPAWEVEDAASDLEREASLRMTEVVQRLHGALAHAPDLAEANELLARIHREQHEAAERRRDAGEAARSEVLLRAHDTGAHAGYLAGLATLTLRTDVPCRARLHRYVTRGRKSDLVLVDDLGTTPIVDLELPIGAYLVELDAGDRPVVRYPVLLERSSSWDCDRPIAIPPAGAVGDDERYVPAGWALLGGDERAPGAAAGGRVWVDGFVMAAHPFLNRDLFAFLALDGPAAEMARKEVLRGGVGPFRPDGPATGVSWETATACAAWWAASTGRRWRLPTEAEWEKAARGADGRWFPWGDFLDPAFAHVRTELVTPNGPRGVHATPDDVSPYGVAGLGGNVRDWCADPFHRDGPSSVVDGLAVPVPLGDAPTRAVRGGSWRLPPEAARAAARAGLPAGRGYLDVGFRLVRSWPG